VTGDEHDDCEPCVAAALLQVVAVRDRLHGVLWAELAPVGAISRAIIDLDNARAMLRAAGVER